ncbi:MAG: hypothetical protein QE284_14335 [Rhizobium sp.]|nr:hypothetical protein [Rhizobium sp.]
MPKGDAQAGIGDARTLGQSQDISVMVVRHEVENLIRRGNIFYWRPRIPAAFIHCSPGSRLSLTLHCSNHEKAQMIGRQLTFGN